MEQVCFSRCLDCPKDANADVAQVQLEIPALEADCGSEGGSSVLFERSLDESVQPHKLCALVGLPLLPDSSPGIGEPLFTAEFSGMQDDTMQAWLMKRLLDQRREVLQHLEEAHDRLVQDFLLQASQRSFATAEQKPPIVSERSPKPAASEGPPMDAEGSSTNQYSSMNTGSFSKARSRESSKMTRLSELAAIMEEEGVKPNCPPEKDFRTTCSKLAENNRSLYWELTRRGHYFEIGFGLVILANACVMAMDQQYRGLQYGYELEIRTYTQPKDRAWPGGQVTFYWLERSFTLIFTLEWLTRLAIMKVRFLKDWWCYLDGSIIVFAWIAFFIDNMMNPLFARVARFSKLLRLIRLARDNEVFDSLKVLVAAIRASVSTLFWTLLILLLVQSAAGLAMSQSLEAFLEDKTQDLEIQRRVFEYWGTFWRAMITMFEITFANWVPSCRLLVEHVDEAYGTFYLLYRCGIGFCVLMVVQAVFIQQTMKTTKLDDDFVAAQRARDKAKLVGRLEKFFKRLDESGDGFLQWEEFVSALRDGNMHGMLEVFDLEVNDISDLFFLLDDGDGRISIDEFVTGVQHVKGPARSIDLMEVKRSLKGVETRLMASGCPHRHR